MMSSGIPISWALRHSAGSLAAGLSLDALLSDSLIELRYGDDRDEINAGQFSLLCMNTALGVEDGAHGLTFSRFHPQHCGMSVRVMLGSPTLESAIEAVARFYNLVSSTLRINLRTTHEHAVVTVRSEGRTPSAGCCLEDTYLTWMFMHFSSFLGRPLPAIDVTTHDPEYFGIGRRHHAIGAPVRLGGAAAFRFPKALLSSPRTAERSDTPHWDCFRMELDFIDSDYSHSPALKWEHGLSSLRLGDLARDAGVSRSTLRRRLKSSQGGFRRSRERALTQAAVERLKSSRDSVEDIAAELGYSDARSFRRFLKSATGHTPREIREGQAVSIITDDSSRLRQRIMAVSALFDR
jgi:AraC-like DNA-binding protein